MNRNNWAPRSICDSIALSPGGAQHSPFNLETREEPPQSLWLTPTVLLFYTQIHDTNITGKGHKSKLKDVLQHA